MATYVVHELPVLFDGQGRLHTARVLGQLAEDGLWEGAIEFRDKAGNAITTRVETRQPNLADLIYWSTGLTKVYLQGAIRRAQSVAAEEALASQDADTVQTARSAAMPAMTRGPRERDRSVRRPARRSSVAKRSGARTRRAPGAHARPR
jgi:hypothetical protein